MKTLFVLCGILSLVVLHNWSSCTTVNLKQGAAFNKFVNGKNGVDSADCGAIEKPCRTIQKAIDNAAPNDAIQVAFADYTESISITKDGIKLIGQVTAEGNPRIVSQAEKIVSIKAKDVLLDNFEITNGAFIPSGNNDNGSTGIVVEPSSRNVTISNNKIHTIGMNYTQCHCYGQGHSINVWSYDEYDEKGKLLRTSEPIEHVNVVGNAISNLHLGRSEAIAINGKVTGFVVSRNTLSELDNIAIDIGGYQEDDIGGDTEGNPQQWQAQDGSITQNDVWNVYASKKPDDSHYNPGQASDYHSMGAIYVDGGTNVRIDGNTVHDSGTGIDFGSEKGGTVENILVQNNVVYRSYAQGIKIGNEARTEKDKTPNTTVRNATIINNTFVDNRMDSEMDDHGTIYFGGASSDHFSGVKIANNIFILTDQTGKNRQYSMTNVRLGGKNLAAFVNNLFFSRQDTFFDGSDGQSFEFFSQHFGASPGWQLQPEDLAKVFINLATFDYRLPAGSIAIDAGDKTLMEVNCSIAKPCFDRLGNPRIVNGKIDIGAFEFQK